MAQLDSDSKSHSLKVRWTSWGRQIASLAGPLVALLVVIAFFSLADIRQGGIGNFNSAGSARIIGIQSIKIAIAALGMTIIIISGGIDLSVGTCVSLSGCVAAIALRAGLDVVPAMGCAIACGAACGFINGVLISVLKLVPFIITLGTMTIFLGIGKTIAEDGGTITPPSGSVPEWLAAMVAQIPDPLWIAWPFLPNFGWGVWLALVLSVIVAMVLYRTIFGRYVFAIGSSEPTARLCGVPVMPTKVLIYSIAGALFGLAGVVELARMGKGDATAGLGLELQVIAAVVIGGGSLAGGRGSVLGTLCGVLIIGVISQGSTALGLENQIEDMLLGVIIIAAVFVDSLRQRHVIGG